MKYALLVFQSQECFDKRNDAEAIAAGRAYGEALQAAGVFVGGAGLDRVHQHGERLHRQLPRPAADDGDDLRVRIRL